MNADTIIFPGFLIADLYKECLVDIDNFPAKLHPPEDTLSAEDKVMISSSEKIKYYGENAKSITIIVNQPDTIYLNKEDLAFLSNILKACQRSTADIAIVNAARQQATYTAIKEQLNPLQILLFDVEPSLIELPFRIPLFQVQTFASSAIMLAPALSALNQPTQEGKLLKTKLWNSLKQIFDI